MKDITLLGVTNFRDSQKRFGVKMDDRRRHLYVLGKTGGGKSTAMENMIIQDIINGHGIAVVDPHGELVEKVIQFVPSHRVNDVIYFNPSDLEFPIAFNVLEKVEPSKRHLIASGLIGVFKKIWAESWGPRLEYLLRNAILALLDYPESTLLGVTRMLADKDYRKKVVVKIEDPIVKAFWIKEFSKYTDKFASEAIAPIQNKVGQFLSVPLIRNVVGQVKSSFGLRNVMDKKQILLMNLSKGRTGEDNSAMLGAMLITKIYLAAMSRVDVPEEQRPDFYLYVDEFQNFATESFADILSEARKYHLCLIMAHQYIAQLDEKVRDAVFGNVGSMMVFRVGAADAEFLEKEFEPVFMQQDLVNIPKFNYYMRLMIDGVASDPFSATGLPPMPGHLMTGNLDTIIKVSRERYAKPRALVEDRIIRWSQFDQEEKTGELKEEGGEYVAKCDHCEKDVKLFFEPDGVRPVYCKDCLKKYRAGEIKPKKKTGQKAEPHAKPEISTNLSEKRVSEKEERPLSLSELPKREAARGRTPARSNSRRNQRNFRPVKDNKISQSKYSVPSVREAQLVSREIPDSVSLRKIFQVKGPINKKKGISQNHRLSETSKEMGKKEAAALTEDSSVKKDSKALHPSEDRDKTKDRGSVSVKPGQIVKF